MEERDLELPVATLRSSTGLRNRWMVLRGALSRWVRGRAADAVRGRHAPLVLTGIVFSGMMFAMGYVAERANRAADAIDAMHRSQRNWVTEHQRVMVYDVEVATQAPGVAPVLGAPTGCFEAPAWSPSSSARPATALFYVRPSFD